MVSLFLSLPPLPSCPSPPHLLLLLLVRVDMDGDGKITFEEIIHELTHCVIGEIEENLQISVEEKIHQLENQLQQEINSSSSSSAKNISHKSLDGKISLSNSIDHSDHHTVSPNLLTYLYDSFQAADTDMNGKLDNTEFWNILRTVLSLTDGDREILEVLSTTTTPSSLHLFSMKVLTL
jgi:Ca2+-binding EF-hand superfamily protein